MRHRDDEVHNSGANNPSNDFLEIFEFQVDFATPANSTFIGPTQIPITEFDSDLCGLVSFACFPQPGTGTTLDPLREVLMHRVQYRNLGTHESLVGNFVVDVDGADQGGIRWFELHKTGAGPWSLHQEGTHAPDTDTRWMGSIALDGAGNLALGYSVSSETTFPSIRYAGRLPIDPPGTLTVGEVSLVEGGASQTYSNRWGDYSSMSVDPVDDCTFWYTNEYIPANGGELWRTRIGKFSFPACGNWAEVPGDGATLSGPEILFYQDARWLFVHGTDDRIYYNTQSAGTWSGWSSGATLAGPTAAVWNGILHLFVRGTDDRIYVNTLQRDWTWSGWSEVPGGGTTLSAPRAVVFKNVLYVVIHGTNDLIYDNLLTLARCQQSNLYS